MVISKKCPAIQYLLLYLMLLLNQSVMQQQLPTVGPYFILLFLFAMILWRRYLEKRSALFLLFLLLMTIVLNITTHGGIGPSHWIAWAMMILSTLLVVYWNPEKVIERYLKVVFFFSGISVFFFAWQIIDINSLKNVFLFHGELAQTYEVYSYFQWEVHKGIAHYSFDGLFLYVVNGMNVIRNVGIYTEPGVYQIVLCTAVYFLLFEKRSYTNINRKLYLFVFVLAIITSQSTTGYINLIVLLLIYLWVHNSEFVDINIKKLIFSILGIIIAFCVIDGFIRRGDSFIYQIVLNKIGGALKETSTTLAVATSSGGARIGTALLAIKTMVLEPWGVGYSKMSELMDTANTGFVGAEFLVMGAAMGIIPFLVILYWLFSPIICSNAINTKIKACVIFITLNTMLAQSAVFYPALIIIPIYYFVQRYKLYEK